MGLFDWVDSKIPNMRWYDIGLVKLSVAGFVLFLAKLWQPLLALEWYWYLVVALVAMIRPLYLVFGK
jgi:hypothetical protein|tara:strand:- start:881 stop:1081 length:201 start_codon:yes stop_codon:yes gene_type:complete